MPIALPLALLFVAQDIIREKPKREVLWISDQQMVYEAIRLMDAHKVGALLVKDADGKKLTGIITERDYLTKVRACVLPYALTCKCLTRVWA